MDVPDGPLRDSGALWQHLVERGDLQMTGHDRELVDELRMSEALQPAPDVPLLEALQDVPVEQLLLALFQLAAPYAAMWQDLLVLFERAAATEGSDQLEVVFDFEKKQPLRFDLESFRRQVEVFRELMAPFDLRRAEDPAAIWRVREAFGRDGTEPVQRPDLLALSESLRSEPFPPALPARPAADDAELDLLLQETWLLAGVYLGDLRAVFGRHDDWPAVEAAPPVPSGLPFEVLRFTESDYWLASLLEALARLSPAGRPGLAEALDGALAPLRNADPELRSVQRRLDDLLSLPLWRHRYDLYSNWVAARIVVALEDQQPVVHAAHRRIEFRFNGTHLATFDRFRPHAHVWCEYRTRLRSPKGKRKGNIQPDLALRRDPLTENLTPLVVECKQYAIPDNQSFADALTDYARGHREATVVLVNYGGGREATVLEKVAEEVRDRTTFIPYFRPTDTEAMTRFVEVVRTSLGLRPTAEPGPERGPDGDPEPAGGREPEREDVREPEPVAPDEQRGSSTPWDVRSIDAGPADSIALSWTREPSDLDLHVTVGQWEIHYGNRGALDAEPYLRLADDVMSPGGTEAVHVSRWLPAVYRVEVVNFSREPPLRAASPVVELTVGGHAHAFVCPSTNGSDRWAVCAIDGRTGVVTSG